MKKIIQKQKIMQELPKEVQNFLEDFTFSSAEEITSDEELSDERLKRSDNETLEGHNLYFTNILMHYVNNAGEGLKVKRIWKWIFLLFLY